MMSKFKRGLAAAMAAAMVVSSYTPISFAEEADAAEVLIVEDEAAETLEAAEVEEEPQAEIVVEASEEVETLNAASPTWVVADDGGVYYRVYNADGTFTDTKGTVSESVLPSCGDTGKEAKNVLY
jgi:hypothetical protein